MPGHELELNPVDFITIGTIGPRGQRIFHLQCGQGDTLVSLTIEKEQASALSDALTELLDDLANRNPLRSLKPRGNRPDMDLREPIQPMFRVAQMGLGYDEDVDRIILVVQEFVPPEAGFDGESSDDDAAEKEPSVVRVWCSREQMRLLSEHTREVVSAGRSDPRQNGRLTYYWT